MHNTTFGERLATLRKERGFSSQHAFAKEIGLAYQTINFYESGKRKPDIEVFKMLADYFDVSYDYLLGVSEARDRKNINVSNILGLKEQTIEKLVELNNKAKNDSVAKIKIGFINQLFINDSAVMLLDSFIRYKAIAVLWNKKIDEIINMVASGERRLSDSQKDELSAVDMLNLDKSVEDNCIEILNEMLNADRSFDVCFENEDIIKVLLPDFMEQKTKYTKLCKAYDTLLRMGGEVKTE